MEQKTDSLAGKKLLILGGAVLHCELINTAKRLGVETYVTDYLPADRSPAKQIADHAWDLNITAVDAIVERCCEEKIDGVLNLYYDPCQRPYQAICEKLGLPCFGNKEQFEIFTDKKRFLKTCVKYGLDIIPQYQEADFEFDNPAIEYPVYVKPSDSRASRGQSVCRCYAEAAPAIEKARCESRNGEVVIERFLSDALNMQLTLLMVDGQLHIENMIEEYKGEKGFSSVSICGLAPSPHRPFIERAVIPKIRDMLTALGIRNSPVFIQGFLDGDCFRAYDPGLRFPAIMFEEIMKAETGLDMHEAMIRFAMSGRFPAWLHETDACSQINGKILANMAVFVRAGVISQICGLDTIREKWKPAYTAFRMSIGDRVEDWHDFRQYCCEIQIPCRDLDEVKTAFNEVYQALQVLDENGEDMKI